MYYRSTYVNQVFLKNQEKSKILLLKLSLMCLYYYPGLVYLLIILPLQKTIYQFQAPHQPCLFFPFNPDLTHPVRRPVCFKPELICLSLSVFKYMNSSWTHKGYETDDSSSAIWYNVVRVHGGYRQAISGNVQPSYFINANVRLIIAVVCLCDKSFFFFFFTVSALFLINVHFFLT